MWINFILLLIFLLPLTVRWLLWLNVFQKKEYRLDRLFSYLKTEEGQKEMLMILPQKGTLGRRTLKRPRPTLRVTLLAIFSLTVLLTATFWGIGYSSLLFLLWLFILLILIPDIILLCSLPFLLFFYIFVRVLLFFAQRKLNQTKPMIIGITGSYGKSSTKHLLAHLLSEKYKVFTTERSYNTPYSLAMQILSRYQGQELVVLEFAAYKPGEIKFLAKKFLPKISIITGLTSQHLATFGSIENIIKAKAELIEVLSGDGIVFYNEVDEGAKKIVEYGLSRKSKKNRVYSYSSPDLIIKYSALSINQLAQLSFELNGVKVNTKIIGKQFFPIIQGAMAVSKWLGLSNQQIVKGLCSFQPNDLFINFFQHQTEFWILDDGRTANPAGFKAALVLSQDIIKERKFTGNLFLITSGLIDLGDNSETIHIQLAKQSKDIFDKVIYLGEAGKEQFKNVFGDNLVEDLSQAKEIISQLTKNDFVLVEGRLPIEIAKLLEINQ